MTYTKDVTTVTQVDAQNVTHTGILHVELDGATTSVVFNAFVGQRFDARFALTVGQNLRLDQ